MKKTLLSIVLILSAFVSLQAQTYDTDNATTSRRRGVSFGADRDTLQFIVASPFDNWYLGFGIGAQTFIGNELYAAARRNKLDGQVYVEIGKWIIPDLSVSINSRLFTVNGQSRYGRQPFLDLDDTPDDRGYRRFSAYGWTLGGLVTLDWTNFFNGYEAGSRKKVHYMTSLGLGASTLFGLQKNTHIQDIELNTPRFNFELYYTGSFGVQYIPIRELAFDFNLVLTGSESTWDWSPYDNSYSRFDVMPMITAGMRINLLRQVHKKDMRKNAIYLDDVNHEFLAYGTKETIKELNKQIEDLTERIDSVLIENGNNGDRNQNDIDSLQLELERLQDQLFNAQQNLTPINPLEDLAQANELLNLPAVIVYFELDKYALDYNSMKRLQSFARQINANPDDTTVFYLIGAADSVTGTPKHNQWLSENRCKVVYDVLVNDLGIKPKRFDVRPLGGIMEYEPKEYNRVTMVILKTKETEEILRKWGKL